jgi:hypothetical protein
VIGGSRDYGESTLKIYFLLPKSLTRSKIAYAAIPATADPSSDAVCRSKLSPNSRRWPRALTSRAMSAANNGPFCSTWRRRLLNVDTRPTLSVDNKIRAKEKFCGFVDIGSWAFSARCHTSIARSRTLVKRASEVTARKARSTCQNTFRSHDHVRTILPAVRITHGLVLQP